jgi:hypothetical protein
VARRTGDDIALFIAVIKVRERHGLRGRQMGKKGKSEPKSHGGERFSGRSHGRYSGSNGSAALSIVAKARFPVRAKMMRQRIALECGGFRKAKTGVHLLYLR